LGEEQPKLLFPRDFKSEAVIFNGAKIERGTLPTSQMIR